MEFSSKDYRELEIKPNSVVYCDPPYKGTIGYRTRKETDFDSESFYSWAYKLGQRRDVKVIISEFWKPEDRFIKIKEMKRTSFFQSKRLVNEGSLTEKLYTPRVL